MPNRRTILVLTRHTPLPWEDGAGAYLFDILRYLRTRGFTIHVGWLAPHDHLRWQGVWKLPRDFAAVATLHAPGAVTLGRYVVFFSVYWLPFKARLLNLVKRTLALAGIRVGRDRSTGHQPRSAEDRLAPRSLGEVGPPSTAHRPPSTGWMAVPSPAEHAFAATLVARIRPSSVFANYAWMTPLFAAVPPDLAPHRVCLHPDVAWKRAEHLARFSGAEPAITREAEAALLQAASTVVGISAADNAELRTLAPEADILLAPKSVLPEAVPLAESGTPRLLFVGSGNNFNVAGLNWFLEDVWPLVRIALPQAELDVCGSVAAAVAPRPAGANFHGTVDDLTPHYRAAAVVIVPLRHATGLNIKLVDAAARGRAIVTTSATLEGAPFLREAVASADDAAKFARATVDLLNDSFARNLLAARALTAVAEHLSPDACYAPLAAALD